MAAETTVEMMKLGPMVSATSAMPVSRVLFTAASTAAIASMTQKRGGSTFSACA